MIDVAITTLLRTPAGGTNRVRPGSERVQITTSALPFVTDTLLSLRRDYTDDGSGLVKARYQVDIYAATLTAARTIADAIRNTLDDYVGTVDATPIKRIYFDDEAFDGATQNPGAQQVAVRYRMDMLVDYRESQS